MSSVTIRDATLSDEAALARVDLATHTSAVSPAPPRVAGAVFFKADTDPADILVAEVDGTVCGWVSVAQAIPLPSHSHVLEINGLGVDPSMQGSGVGRLLVAAAIAEARRRGASKLTLRVLGTNPGARRLYESCGFVVEGVLSGEFILDGHPVDDVLMALTL